MLINGKNMNRLKIFMLFVGLFICNNAYSQQIPREEVQQMYDSNGIILNANLIINDKIVNLDGCRITNIPISQWNNSTNLPPTFTASTMPNTIGFRFYYNGNNSILQIQEIICNDIIFKNSFEN